MTTREFCFQNLSKMSKHQDRERSHTSYLSQCIAMFTQTIIDVIFSNEGLIICKTSNCANICVIFTILCIILHFDFCVQEKTNMRKILWGWSLNVDTCQLLNLFRILLFVAQKEFSLSCVQSQWSLKPHNLYNHNISESLVYSIMQWQFGGALLQIHSAGCFCLRGWRIFY